METMYMDKCGAAAVFGTMRALATVRPATKVVGILAMAENAIGAKAYKPYAVIDSHAGSVQVRLSCRSKAIYNTHVSLNVILCNLLRKSEGGKNSFYVFFCVLFAFYRSATPMPKAACALPTRSPSCRTSTSRPTSSTSRR